MEMSQPRGRVSTSLKLRYSMGGAAEGATMYAFNGFNFVIYTIIFGMPGTLVGLAVFLSIVLDAISDPLIGYLSDRWKSLFFTGGPKPDLDTSAFAASVGIFGATVIFLTAYLTREQIPNLRQAPDNLPAISLNDFLSEARVVFRNRNYMMLFYGLFCLSPMIGVRETLGQNMSLFYRELSPRQIGLLPIFTMMSYFVAAGLVAPLTKRFDKGGTMRIAVAAAAIASSTGVILRSLGWLPENGSPFILYIVGGSAFVYYGSLSILTTSVYSAIGDVVDEHEFEIDKKRHAEIQDALNALRVT